MKLFFAIIISFFLFPQTSPEKIFWKENQKLTWEDFRGKPIPSASFVASTNTGISFQYSYSIKNGTVEVAHEVHSFFNPEGSWYIAKRVNPHILRHEQGHFDISELHARKLRKMLHGRQYSKNVKREIEGIYRKIERQRRTMQNKFDAETDHSRNEAQEKSWQHYIAQQLAAYERWK